MKHGLLVFQTQGMIPQPMVLNHYCSLIHVMIWCFWWTLAIHCCLRLIYLWCAQFNSMNSYRFSIMFQKQFDIVYKLRGHFKLHVWNDFVWHSYFLLSVLCSQTLAIKSSLTKTDKETRFIYNLWENHESCLLHSYVQRVEKKECNKEPRLHMYVFNEFFWRYLLFDIHLK